MLHQRLSLLFGRLIKLPRQCLRKYVEPLIEVILQFFFLLFKALLDISYDVSLHLFDLVLLVVIFHLVACDYFGDKEPQVMV